jgi:hypothetical protein
VESDGSRLANLIVRNLAGFMYVEEPVSAANCGSPAGTCLQIWWDRHPAQHVARDDQVAIAELAMLAESCRNIHGIAEIGKLSFDPAAFAHDHWPAMQAGTEARHRVELFLVLTRKSRNLGSYRQEAFQAEVRNVGFDPDPGCVKTPNADMGPIAIPRAFAVRTG